MVVTTVVLATNVALLSGLAVVGWRNREVPSARAFAVLESVAAVWAASTALGLHLPPGQVRLRVWGVTTGLSLAIVALWFGFILQYTGRDEWLAPRRFGLLTSPLLVGTGIYFVAPTWPLLVGQIEQARITAGAVIHSSIGPVGAVLAVYIYATFLSGCALVVKTVLESDSPFVGQAVAFVVGTLVTVLGSVGQIVGFPVEGYPLTQVALGPQAVFWSYAVFRQEFVRLVPAVARLGERAVFDEIDAGVLVIDGRGNVLRANPRARSYLDAPDPVGDPVASHLETVAQNGFEDVPRRITNGNRTYRVTASTVRNWRDDPVGRVVVVRDVTTLVRRQQRLEVLNRILRHNVRNDMNVVLGRAAELQHHDDEAVAAIGGTVARKAGDLVRISEKAVELERTFDRKRVATEVTLDELVTGVVEPLANRHPDATVDLTVPSDRVRTDQHLLSLVLEEVVENALVHTGPAPTVSVAVDRRDGGVRFTVADDGPGIPSNEVDSIRAGEETDLQHASSLGLWLIYWGTEALDGEVDIATGDDGSTVSLWIPDG